MPASPSAVPHGPGRREVLLAGLVVLAAAGGGAALATIGPPGAQAGHPAPPAELLAAYAAEQELIGAIDVSGQADTSLRADLAAIRADHAAHADALAAILDGYFGTPRPPVGPAAQARTRAELAAAEQHASGAASSRAAALAGPVATVLACIAASEATHQQVLGS